MRAVVLHSHGGPEVLTLDEVPDPQPGPDEVLVAVTATAVNRADLLQRKGLYANPFPEEAEIPGLEFSGRVLARGRRAWLWSVGDAVMGITAGGGYAERIAVHERQLLRVPQGIALADAAAIPEVFLTAWDALVVQGGLTSGRWALVHAGASGVGTAAIQLAGAIGARVVATCSGGKIAACQALGADRVVDRDTEDFVAVLGEVSGGVGADVILDVVGGDYTARNLRAVAAKGTIVQVGVMAGGNAPFDLGTLLSKRVRLIGTVLRARPVEEKIALTQRFAAEILPLFDAGALRPVIDSRYPLTEIANAHEAMAANANVGKIVVDVNGR